MPGPSAVRYTRSGNYNNKTYLWLVPGGCLKAKSAKTSKRNVLPIYLKFYHYDSDSEKNVSYYLLLYKLKIKVVRPDIEATGILQSCACLKYLPEQGCLVNV